MILNGGQMTREQIEQELAEAQRELEIAIANVHRVNGAIAAFELLLQKMDEKDAANTKPVQEQAGESPKENKHGKV